MTFQKMERKSILQNLFSDDQNHFNHLNSRLSQEHDRTEQLFDQDVNEDEDFEIPAFLRRQKF